MVMWSGEVQVRAKSQKYSEFDISGREIVEFLFGRKNPNLHF